MFSQLISCSELPQGPKPHSTIVEIPSLRIPIPDPESRLPGYLPTMCGRSLLFSSQMLSIRSVSGTRRPRQLARPTVSYTPSGSSIVTLMLMRPMFGRVKRSITRSASVAGQAAHVEPGLAVLSDRFDDERVAFPVADGVAHPGRLCVLRERAAIGEDLPVNRARLVQDDHHVRRLHDLEAVGDVVLLGDAGWPAAHAGMILPVVLDAFLVDRLRPGLQRHLAWLQIRGEIQEVLDGLGRHPEAGRSGLPSAVLRAGAFMSTLPSAVRGMFFHGYGSHCASSVVAATKTMREADKRSVFMAGILALAERSRLATGTPRTLGHVREAVRVHAYSA